MAAVVLQCCAAGADLMWESDQDYRDRKLSEYLAEERREFRRQGYANCQVCGQLVRGSGPWCTLYMQGELPCVGRRMGPQRPEMPVG